MKEAEAGVMKQSALKMNEGTTGQHSEQLQEAGKAKEMDSSLQLTSWYFLKRENECVKSLSRFQLLAIPWTVAHQIPCSWSCPGKNTGVGSRSLLQGIFLAQGSNLGLLHCRQILYHLGHQGTPGYFRGRPILHFDLQNYNIGLAKKFVPVFSNSLRKHFDQLNTYCVILSHQACGHLIQLDMKLIHLS